MPTRFIRLVLLRRYFPLSLMLFIPALFSCLYTPTPSKLIQAENFRKNFKYELAIEAYEEYIEERLSKNDYSAEHDPNFYFLLIGDCYLGLDKPEKAKEAFVIAQQKGANKELVGAKIRTLAEWYSDRTQFENAIAVLKEFRSLDPILFDIDIDSNHKRLIQYSDGVEENGGAGSIPLY